jgi:hypothetical protein
MQRRICSILLALLCVTYLSFGVANAADKALSLISTTGQSIISVTAGEPVVIEVRVNDASTVAGASFTVTYDTANLALTRVESDFFGSFANQNIPTPSNQGYVTVDNKNYDTPIVESTVSNLQGDIATGSMFAAARVDNGTGINVKLFTLSFTAGSPGVYPISVVQSKINNTDAGYSASGELIPFLVGIGPSGTYPTHTVTVNSASIVIDPELVDIDADLIDDTWEKANVPIGTTGNLLGVFSKDGDYDEDGYSDYQEYLNRDLRDPEDGLYDPVEVNTQGGVGYVSPSNGINVLPAILQLMLDQENE